MCTICLVFCLVSIIEFFVGTYFNSGSIPFELITNVIQQETVGGNDGSNLAVLI